ncbi:hypothetical protein N657DRAFT_611730 [Parathielavia appendiculata]|uniref:N-acetyltransferase domain-containing protein n=1 Tax=Parathielavia appendiculata TaxID=2587402 RepID=A0AAN6U6C1_9PEZI|nr:hypothetical protein N657DRAFT_611730 [Parathielavia appendiculata]
MPPAHELRTWTRQIPGDDHRTCTYIISTDPSLIQLDALNAALGSDMIYWAQPVPLETLRLCVEQSLCFGLYIHDEQGANGDEDHGKSGDGKVMTMIGLSRLVTDYTTFGYLTDVYVLASHQGKGLGKWMMQCLDEVLSSWPHLRRCLLFTSGEAAVKMYRATIGAKYISETPSKDLVLLERRGTAATFKVGKAMGADASKTGTEKER